jgi:hypothetical protein
MKKLITGVLLVAISCLPAIAEGAALGTAKITASEPAGLALAKPAQLDIAPGSAFDYAAREAAAPQLGGFAGGGGGVYIGTGAVVVVLLVVIVVLLVR